MAKPINIPVNVPGADQAKTDLDKVAGAAKGIGDETQKAGQKGKSGLEQLSSAWSSIHSLVFGAIAATIAGAAFKVAHFFDEIKTRSAEAVLNLQSVRAEMAGIFQAMGNVSETSQQNTTAYVTDLMKKTKVSKEVAYPVTEAYARQFYGKIPQADYDQGLEGMVGYAARRGTTATTEMIGLMPGFGIKTPAQMGELRRMVSAAAQRAGLTEEDIVNALGRAMPTAQAMGWSYEQALTMIATLAQGQIGKQKTTLPAATMEAVMSPQETKFKEYGLNPKDTPQQIFTAVRQKASTMNRNSALKMLGDIYGTGASRGMLQLMSPMAPLVSGTANAEQALEKTRQENLPALVAETNAKIQQDKQKVDMNQVYAEKVLEIGEEQQKQFQIKNPVRQKWEEFITPGTEAEKQAAARQAWWESLSDKEQQQIIKEENSTLGFSTSPTGGIFGPSVSFSNESGLTAESRRWSKMSSKQQYDALQRNRSAPSSMMQGSSDFVGPPTFIQYIHNMNFNPTVGNNKVGPRASPSDLGM